MRGIDALKLGRKGGFYGVGQDGAGKDSCSRFHNPVPVLFAQFEGVWLLEPGMVCYDHNVASAVLQCFGKKSSGCAIR